MCFSSPKHEHRKPNSAVTHLLNAAAGNLLEGGFSAVQQEDREPGAGC